MTIAANTSGGWSGTLSDAATLGTDIYGLVNSAQQTSQAQTMFNQSNPFGAYRPTYGNMLLNLIQNPSSVTNLPGYKFMMDQGTQAIDRSAAAPGGSGLGSGGEMMDLEKYGQGLADQFYSQQVSTLAQLAGANISPTNPANAFKAGQSAAQGVGSSVQGILSDIGTAKNLYSDISSLFSGPSAAGGEAAMSSAAGNAVAAGADAYGAAAGTAATTALAPTLSAEMGSTAASVAASNEAALTAQIASEGEAGSAAGASSASSGAIGGSAAADIAIPVAAFAAMYLGGNALNNMLSGPNNNWGINQINDLIKNVQGGVKSGNLSTSTAAGSFNPMNANGTVNTAAVQSMADLTQLQDGDFGQADSYVAKQLNQLGFKTVGQQVAANGGWRGSGGGGGSMRGVHLF